METFSGILRFCMRDVPSRSHFSPLGQIIGALPHIGLGLHREHAARDELNGRLLRH